MSIDGIIQRIERDALAEAEKIKQKYLTQVAELEREFQRERDEIIEEARKRAESERKKAMERAIDHARLNASQMILKRKTEILSELYASVQRHIENMHEEDYREFFARLVLRLNEPSAKIIVAADRDVLGESFLKLLREMAERSKRDIRYTIEVIDAPWRGVYVDCGKVQYNLTIDAIMQSARERTENFVISRLFEQ